MQEASAEHQWVLCVDDDVLLYETFLENLITSMQQRPSFFMATGEPSFVLCADSMTGL